MSSRRVALLCYHKCVVICLARVGTISICVLCRRSHDVFDCPSLHIVFDPTVASKPTAQQERVTRADDMPEHYLYVLYYCTLQ